MNAQPVRMFLIVCSCLAVPGPTASPRIFAEGSRPKVTTPDLQGTWNLVSWERGGKAEKLPSVRFFITQSTIYCEGVSLPDETGCESWHYELDPGDKSNAAVMNLDAFQGRELVPAICALDGEKLRIALGRVTKTRGLPLKAVPVERPKEFATKPGSDQLLLVLERAAAAEDPIALLRKLGGTVTITLGTEIHLDNGRAKDDDLGVLKKLPSIHTLALRHCQITDAGLAHLKDMADLQSLTLADLPVTDKGLVHLEGLRSLSGLMVKCAKVSGAGLKGLTRIKWLGLQGSAFTDADLAHLEGLTQVQSLDLGKTAITNAGLTHLKPLTILDTLSLDDTKVTDTGLEHLQRLTKIRYLSLRGTKVTANGVRTLRAAIPGLEEIVR
jgi:hypothetical protein